MYNLDFKVLTPGWAIIPYTPLKGPFIGFITGILRPNGPSWEAVMRRVTMALALCRAVISLLTSTLMSLQVSCIPPGLALS